MRIRTLCVVTLLLGLAALSAQAYRLQFKDPVGAERTYKTTMHMKGTAEVMGMEMPTDTTVTMTSVEKVLGKNANGSSKLSYIVKDGKVKATVTVPGTDEDQKVDQNMPSFTINYSRAPSGKVTDVKMTGDVDQTLQSQLSSLNGQMEYPGQGLEFPDKDLKVGDSWEGTQTFQLAEGAALNFKVKYKITGTKVVDGTTYLVFDNDINAKVTNMKVKTPAGAGGALTDLTVSMTITGTESALFDPNAGELGSSSFNMNVDLNMKSSEMSVAMKMVMDGEMARK